MVFLMINSPGGFALGALDDLFLKCRFSSCLGCAVASRASNVDRSVSVILKCSTALFSSVNKEIAHSSAEGTGSCCCLIKARFACWLTRGSLQILGRGATKCGVTIAVIERQRAFQFLSSLGF